MANAVWHAQLPAATIINFVHTCQHMIEVVCQLFDNLTTFQIIFFCISFLFSRCLFACMFSCIWTVNKDVYWIGKVDY